MQAKILYTIKYFLRSAELTTYLVLAAMLLCGTTIAQERIGNAATITQQGANGIVIGFDKLLNRYQWNTDIVYANTFGPVSVSLKENFLSSLIKTDNTFIRDENTASLDLLHPIISSYRGFISARLYTLSDDQTVALGKAGSRSIQYGIALEPFPFVTLLPRIGVRSDHQVDRRDQGLVYNFGFHTRGATVGGYDLSVNGENERATLSPRVLETYRDTIALRKRFYEQTQAQFTLSYFRNRRDFYQGTNSAFLSSLSDLPEIETRTEHAYMVTAQFDYGAGSAWHGFVRANVLSHDVGRQTTHSAFQSSALSPEMNELRLAGDAMVIFTPGRSLILRGALSALSREEENGVTVQGPVQQSSIDSALQVQEIKNNKSLRTSLLLEGTLMPSPSDTINLSLSNSLMRYDTPSLQNNDDRDELRHLIVLHASHRFNSYLHATLRAEASLTHLVYLSSLRSSENTWNRIFRLAPGIVCKPTKTIYTANTFEVLANYTVYDYEYLASSIRSFTFRQFAWIDSTVFTLSNRLALAWWNSIRLYERGELQWSEFTERPRMAIEEKTYTGEMQYHPTEFLLFSIGIRYFSQLRYTYSGLEKQEDAVLSSVGPTTTIEWMTGTHARLALKGWYERLQQTGQPERTNANITMNCSVFF